MLTALLNAAPRRVKNFHQRSSQFEQILKKNEQMFALLALTAGLCPAATRVLDESVLNLLQDKCALNDACDILCHAQESPLGYFGNQVILVFIAFDPGACMVASTCAVVRLGDRLLDGCASVPSISSAQAYMSTHAAPLASRASDIAHI